MQSKEEYETTTKPNPEVRDLILRLYEKILANESKLFSWQKPNEVKK